MKVYGFVGGKGDLRNHLLQALNGRLSHRSVSTLLTGKPDGIEKEMAQPASIVFRFILCFVVDSWINTGKKEGTEQVWERTAYPVLLPLQDFIERNPPLLRVTAKGPALVLFPQNWDEQKKPSAFLKEAYLSLQRLPDAQLLAFPSRILPFAYDAAMALFLQILDSPARTRLFRCDGCRAYFMRARAPKKDTPIYHGSWCVKCKGKGGAVRTSNSRDRRTAKMIEWAADGWAQWKQGSGRSKRTEWVAQKVNERLGRSRDPIAANWVTRHKGEIETEVERRNHAKG